ncbi:uncharacterized protein ABDE67_009725 [Symphorus nematophorus]
MAYLNSLIQIYTPSCSLRSVNETRLIPQAQRGPRLPARIFSFVVPRENGVNEDGAGRLMVTVGRWATEGLGDTGETKTKSYLELFLFPIIWDYTLCKKYNSTAQVRIIQPEELSTPTNDQPSSVDNSTGVGGGSEHQPSSGNGEIHHQEENVVVQPHGPLIPGAPVPRENRVNEDDAGRPMVTLGRWIAETLLLRGVHLLGGWATEGLHRWATDNLGSWAGGPAVVLGRWATEYLAGRATVALRRWLGDRDVGIIQPEELSTPVECQTNPRGFDAVVVYDDITYRLTSVGDQQPRDGASSVDNLTGIAEELRHQLSSRIHHQEENPVFLPRGSLTIGGRFNAQLIPVCLRETTHRATVPWWSQNGPRMLIALTGVMILLFFILIFFVFKPNCTLTSI